MGLFRQLSQDASAAAQALLGQLLVRNYRGKKLVGEIVEVEAYHQNDPSAHSYRGQTKRTEVLFGPAGFAYIYFTYGMHYCMNVSTGEAGEGSAVLIRALEPLEGLEVMKRNRKISDQHNLTSGPAKLAQALVIDKNLYGHDLTQPPLQLQESTPVKPSQIVSAKRIGISKAVDELQRFYIKDNAYVSQR